MVAIAIGSGSDPTLMALGETNGRLGGHVGTLGPGGPVGAESEEASRAATVAVAVVDDATARPVGSVAGQAGAGSPPDRTTDGPCAEPRRLTDERCAVANRASGEAARAADELHAARRAYDDHLTRAEAAAADADPRAVRAAKDAAQHAYRVARSGAGTPEEQEAAAAAWLAEINHINAATKEAETTAARERDRASSLVLTIERLTVHADAARISAEAAQEICVQAREALVKHGYTSSSRTVLVVRVEDSPGALAALAKKLGDAGVDIVSAIHLGTVGGYAQLALGVDNIEKARSLV